MLNIKTGLWMYIYISVIKLSIRYKKIIKIIASNNTSLDIYFFIACNKISRFAYR